MVVQMTAKSLAPAGRRSPQRERTASLSGIGNATVIDGSVRSSYSTSASASAVRQVQHQSTALNPNVTSPLAAKTPKARAISAWYEKSIVRYGFCQVPRMPRRMKSVR